MNAGDTVWYVPGRAHVFDLHRPENEYPWVLGYQPTKQSPVEELQGPRLADVLADLRRLPNQEKAQEQLVLLRPQRYWRARVAQVHADGTVDLDTACAQPGVTLHYKRVPVAPRSEQRPHSCHALSPS